MNPKHSNATTSLLAALGLFGGSALPKAPGLPSFAGVHTNSKRNKQRKLCREVGHRQARRLKCLSYALKAGRLSA